MIYKIFFNHLAHIWFRGLSIPEEGNSSPGALILKYLLRGTASEVRRHCKNLDSINAKDIFCTLSARQMLIASCKLKRANECLQ